MKGKKNKTTVNIFSVIYRELLGAMLVACMLSTGLCVYAKSTNGITSTTLMYALENVNVHTEPGMDMEVLGQLQKGETIYAVELTEEGWYRVVFLGEKGYIPQEFLAVYGTEIERDAPSYQESIQTQEETETLETDTEWNISSQEESVQTQETEDTAELEYEAAEREEPEERVEEPMEKQNGILLIVVIVVIFIIVACIGLVIWQDKRNKTNFER